MLNKMICALVSHSINRNRVWHDGLDFRTKCARCGHPLVRTEHGWRPYSEELDDDSRRQPHPGH